MRHDRNTLGIITTCSALLLLMSGCGVTTSGNAGTSPESSATSAPAHGTLSGQVVARASCGAQNSVTPCPLAPVPRAALNILTPAGAVVTSVTSDQQGRFSVTLPPGSYMVQPAPTSGTAGIKGPAVAATVVAGQTVSIQVVVSAGLPRS